MVQKEEDSKNAFEVLDLQNTAKKSSDILQDNKEDLVRPVEPTARCPLLPCYDS